MTNVVARILLACLLLSAAAEAKPKPEDVKAARLAAQRKAKLLENSKLSSETVQKITDGKRLTRKERKQVRGAEREKYVKLRKEGADEVSNSDQAVALRSYRLRNKKRRGIIRKKEVSLANVLFPGVSPEEYTQNERIWAYADLVESRKTPIPYEYYDLPGCSAPVDTPYKKQRRERKNLGSRLQGHDKQVAPFDGMRVLVNQGCTPICSVTLDSRNLRWLRRMIKRQYRVQLTLDQLPVLMRSKEYNYAVRGYPVGFEAPASFKALKTGEYYIFNHLKFVVTYHQSTEFEGVRITGFDVMPISVQHALPSDGGAISERATLDTCNGETVPNDPEKYLALRAEGRGSLPVVYSYEVQWESSTLPWSDRWDVYLVGAPDDDLHYFSIVNSLMIVLFLTGAISTIMIRTLRKDIQIYQELDDMEEGAEETGWKLVHGDVFRPPQTSPMLLSVLVGTGAQVGTAFVIAMLAAMAKLLNPVQKGQTLTALIVLYVFCGVVSGYVSSRIYKYMDGKQWKLNTIMTACAIPGCIFLSFAVLNVFLGFAGAATAVSFLTVMALFLLWVCVCSPLVFIGAFFGLRREKIEVPCKTNQIARVLPPMPWHVQPFNTFLLGGILPFGSVCIELAFIMSALWLHQLYYVMGFLLAVIIILAATCAQVSMVLTYLQLCAENHRWWWSSFMNTASAGVYLFLYSLWFLSSRLHMVGFLPVVVYLSYMGMISIIFGIFCGSVGFLASFWFTRTIYGAVKVD